ncbi:hypothetical protein LCGC14_2592470 [marine sediment metagenome]|uniref:Uncharacterized protein n=1 Tax=marine sediment metagenome TaxID=412755 RepID=A0A0F9D3X8_9ZZZZ
MLISEGHRRLQAALADLVQAVEARAMGLPRQVVNDILHERRGVTVSQTVLFRARYRIPISAWTVPAE